MEIEPNEPCESAQDLGEPAIPYDLMGKIDLNDVDSFRIQAEEGQSLAADLVAC
jgi:hypothetical protein